MKIDSIMVGPIMTNCYLLSDETAGVCALIDPGDEAPRVLDMVARSGCQLQYILLTHGHRFGVKSGLEGLLALAGERGLDLICFGHTHQPLIHREKGCLFLNPGSMGYGSEHYAILTLEAGVPPQARLCRLSDGD